MYGKVINQETKQCEVAFGDNIKLYKSIGMSPIDCEQAYDGQWYLKGYVPAKPGCLHWSNSSVSFPSEAEIIPGASCPPPLPTARPHRWLPKKSRKKTRSSPSN